MSADLYSTNASFIVVGLFTLAIASTSIAYLIFSHYWKTSKAQREKKCSDPGSDSIIVDLKALPSRFVQSELVPKEYRNQTISSNMRGHLEEHWVVIYAFLGLSFADRLQLRCMCRLFHEVEKILTLNRHDYKKMLTPMPKYTWFPHPKYPTLNGLMDELNKMYVARPGIVWDECTAPEMLSVGTVVRARFVNSSERTHYGRNSSGRTLNKYFPNKFAKINQINNDDNDDNETTFDIVYDDGDTRKNVPLNEMQRGTVSAWVIGLNIVIVLIILFFSSLFSFLISLLSFPFHNKKIGGKRIG